MQQLTTGLDYDNFEFHENLVKCLNDTDPLLYESVNSQWVRFRAFAAAGGDRIGLDDPWYSCDEDEITSEVNIHPKITMMCMVFFHYHLCCIFKTGSLV